MSVTDLPDCAWCSAANTLKPVVGLEAPIYECSCCSHLTRLDEKNRAHRLVQSSDVSGVPIEGHDY